MTNLPNRYEYRRLLGSGGMGEVHLVWDRERSETLALKTLRTDPAASPATREEALFLFRQEFGAMATLRHPNLVAGHDFGFTEDGTPYYTMDAVPGRDLAEALPVDEASVRSWLPGIISALTYLHARGFLHGDLKPENIRLHEDGTPRLMDLGLLGRAGQAGGAVRGSLHYVAPECVRGAALDGRSDLYALGAVIYHALAARPPFDPAFEMAPLQVLRAHLEQAPQPLAALAPATGAQLSTAVMKLLAKQPADRYQAGWEVLEALDLGSLVEREASLLSAPLMGRDEVLEELRRSARGTQGGTLQLVGPEGSGKSRLLAEWRSLAQLEVPMVLHARGLGPDAPPYEALKPWLKALVATPSPERERLAPLLVRLVPELGVEPAPALDGSQERVRLHTAVADLALHAAPSALWLLDDADRLDAASRELLGVLRARGQAYGWHWVVAAEQATEGGGRVLVLPPLTEAQTHSLAAAMLGRPSVPPILVEKLLAVTGGLPGPAVTLIGHWASSGALAWHGSGWELVDEAGLALPGGLTVVLDARFEALTPNARLVGKAAAVLGPAGPLAPLAAACGFDETSFFAALMELEAAGTLQREAEAFRFTRPMQAEALAAAVAPAEARRLHGLAAAWWERRLGNAPDAAPLGDAIALARHHLAGDAPARAIPWVLAAAARSAELFSLGAMIGLFEGAVAVENVTPAELARLLVYQATALRYLGRIDEALELQQTRILPHARATDAPDLAEQACSLGILLQLKGRYAEAFEHLEAAIARAEARQEATILVRAHLVAGRSAFFAGETGRAREHLKASIAVGRAHPGHHPMWGSALGLYAYVLATLGPEHAAESQALFEEAIAVNTATDNTYSLHETYNNLGSVYLTRGQLLEALPIFERCLQISERTAMENERCFNVINLGATSLDLGRIREARAFAKEAVELARKQGRRFPEGYGRALDGVAAVLQGEVGAGLDQLDLALRTAREIGNRYLELSVLVRRVDALVHLGRFAQARQDLEAARTLAEQTQNTENTSKLNRYAAVIALQQDAPEAGPLLVDVLADARREGHPATVAHALRWQAERLHRAGQKDLALTLIEEAAEQAALGGLVLLGAELRDLWGRALEGVDNAAAAERFQEGRELASASGSWLGEVLCQAGYGRTHPAGRDDRIEAPRRLEAFVREMDEVDTQAFLAWPERGAALRQGSDPGDPEHVARLRHLTDLIATITSQPDLPRIMQQALVALVDVAGAERGFLLLYNGFEVTQQVFYGMDERDNDEFSSTLAHQVLWSGEPLFVEDASTHNAFGDRASVQALSLRSVVAVPLHDGQETLGVMMADSQRINARFGPEDMDLAMALARQVAIAIVNARSLERFRNSHAEHEVLNRLALALLRTETLEEAFGCLAAEAIPLCAVSRAVWMESGRIRLAVDATGQSIPTEAAEISDSVVEWVQAHAEPLHLVDAQSDELFQGKASVQALGLHTVFAVPIRHRDETLGVLYLDHPAIVEEDPRALHTLRRLADLFGALWSRHEPARVGQAV